MGKKVDITLSRTIRVDIETITSQMDAYEYEEYSKGNLEESNFNFYVEEYILDNFVTGCITNNASPEDIFFQFSNSYKIIDNEDKSKEII